MGRLLFVAFILFPLEGLARAATPCPPAAYLPLVVRVEGAPPAPLFPPDSATGVFVLGSDSVTIGACGATPARIHAGRRLTVIRKAVWDDCPGFGRVRFRGATNYPPCMALVGILRWRDSITDRKRALKFEALRVDE